jgi:hypothetical protein
MWFVAFDIGIKNLAFVVLDIPVEDGVLSYSTATSTFRIIEFQLTSLIDEEEDKMHAKQSRVSTKVLLAMYEYLNAFHLLWENCSVILIEQQMQFKNQNNIQALKLAQHVISFFIQNYPTKNIIEYPAYHKTQLLGAPKKMTKYARKKWATQTVKDILSSRVDEKDEMMINFLKLKKQDDISDCFLMIFSYCAQQKL